MAQGHAVVLDLLFDLVPLGCAAVGELERNWVVELNGRALAIGGAALVEDGVACGVRALVFGTRNFAVSASVPVTTEAFHHREQLRTDELVDLFVSRVVRDLLESIVGSDGRSARTAQGAGQDPRVRA